MVIVRSQQGVQALERGGGVGGGTSLSVLEGYSAALGKQTEPFPRRLPRYFLIHPPLMGSVTPPLQAGSSESHSVGPFDGIRRHFVSLIYREEAVESARMK